ncbi:hypothetical protein [Streptomyces sp. SPB4]|uniref:hypothetical protein n=1 Tax=Streptomyces sp. SPB4 TaxID=2940553 RepID=UPI002474C92E|nr:hypothetical protein [Streptomyces sp. SPB4]MDH6541005.1 hypothetical protein [Streptomyces sp. SPB4]
MPEHAPTPRVCRDCDGFATATITTGLRTANGTRDTLPVHCPACRGLGLSVPARLVRTGK